MTNPPVSHYETRPLEPCAEIATAEAAMADEDPKGGGGSVFKLLLDDPKISEVLRTVIICSFFGAMTRGFFVKLQMVAESVAESLGDFQGVTGVYFFFY